MNARPFLTAEWRHLAMLNFDADAELLRSFVPPGTELDLWNGTAIVTLVGFRFLNTRLLGLPVPFHRNFDEVNLRLYVRRRAPEGWRRGVVFIKEIAPRRAVALVANRVYNEKYVVLPMRHRLEPSDANGERVVEYGWKLDGQQSAIRVRAGGAARRPDEGSEERFVIEHYWGHGRARDGGTLEYRVEHPTWRIWSVREAEFVCHDIEGLYGTGFGEVLAERPRSALLAEGSSVAVYKATRLEG